MCRRRPRVWVVTRQVRGTSVYVEGQYVGLGAGIPPAPPDSSAEIANIKAWLKARFTPARLTLDDGPVFTQALVTEVTRVQQIRVREGKLEPDAFIPGIINLASKYAFGYLKKEIFLPLCFTVEGHMSDMWVGPVAHVGEVLRHEGRALHFPTFYTNNAIPFKTYTAVDELARRLRLQVQDNGIKFPPGTPFVLGGFSEGAMAVYEFYHQYLAPGKSLAWRLKDLRGVVSVGSPHREKGVLAEWVTGGPAPDRQGLSDVRMVDTPWWWKEVAKAGDLYTDNQSSGDRALFKTSCYKMIAKGQFTGGPAGFLARVIDLLTPADDLIPLALAIYDAMKFGINMSPHMVHDMAPAVQFMRDQLAAPPIAA